MSRERVDDFLTSKHSATTVNRARIRGSCGRHRSEDQRVTDTMLEVMMKAELVFMPMPRKGHFVSMVQLAKLLDEQNVNIVELKDLDTEFTIPSYLNLVSSKLFPTVMLKLESLPMVNTLVRGI
ncbi:hypothetical protein J1N35_013574 [Gossypium stocksii]|uniref:Uncharacterized protein n=1 Tax=Gossypium stocksii TaxID=47602 RepID=A0A9D3VTZ5_9ROSI|nr:hypothetical protein J1N35_013574 [Gossypium stocksii]